MIGGAIQVNIVGVDDRGASKLVTARVNKLHLTIKVPSHELVPGRQGRLVFPPERTMIFAGSEAVSRSPGRTPGNCHGAWSCRPRWLASG